jgi:L-ascorbate metabolism protein UlaG (beta-lactamase superfamily)
VALAVGGFAFTRTAPFGAEPEGERKKRVEASPNWRDGAFRNPQPLWIDIFGAMRGAFTSASDDATPRDPVDVVRTDPAAFAAAPASGVRVTWFGHSSALIEVDGARILTDPIWSERSGPVEFAGPQRFYEPTIRLADLPPLDAVVISHDHWDHLDTATIRELATTEAQFVVPLGVGAHLERWGVRSDRVTELDWWGTTSVAGVELHATPARHQSGRINPSSSGTLWAGWAIVGPEHRAWYSGDSGFHDELEEIGRRLGPFDVALVESGQYDEHWPDVHYGPELAVEAARRVRADVMVPVHWALFSLAPHAWTEPVERVIAEAACVGQPVRVLRPGEPSEPTTSDGTITVGGTATATKKWWPELRTRTAAEAPVVGTRSGDPEVRLDFRPCTTRAQ